MYLYIKYKEDCIYITYIYNMSTETPEQQMHELTARADSVFRTCLCISEVSYQAYLCCRTNDNHWGKDLLETPYNLKMENKKEMIDVLTKHFTALRIVLPKLAVETQSGNCVTTSYDDIKYERLAFAQQLCGYFLEYLKDQK